MKIDKLIQTIIINKYSTFVFIALFTAFTSFCIAQEKIYTTLDVSKSMLGWKYDIANYGTQVISVLNHNNDVYLIVKEQQAQKISTQNYNSIQKNVDNIGSRNGNKDAEIKDLRILNKIAQNSNHPVKLFIIGDGEWIGTWLPQNLFDEISSEFKTLVDNGKIIPYFLQVVDDKGKKTDFEEFYTRNNLGKHFKVSSADEIVAAINAITEDLTGVSAVPPPDIKEENNCLTYAHDLVVNGLEILYQDRKRLSDIPKIISVKIDGKEIDFSEIGNPSNEQFESKTGGLISSRVYEYSKEILKGSKIEICFDKPVSKEKLRIYPITQINSNTEISTDKGQYSKIDENTIGVCKDNKDIVLSIEFNQSGKHLDAELLKKKAEVYFISNNKRFKGELKDGKFYAKIPLTGDITYYRIESKISGSTTKNSGQKKIVKTEEDCKELPPPPKGSIELKYQPDLALSKDSKQLKLEVRLVDKETQIPLNLNDFNIQSNNPNILLLRQ